MFTAAKVSARRWTGRHAFPQGDQLKKQHLSVLSLRPEILSSIHRMLSNLANEINGRRHEQYRTQRRREDEGWSSFLILLHLTSR